jgi:NADPH:quinone reductase-like Zn-dependent oxidoreductase
MKRFFTPTARGIDSLRIEEVAEPDTLVSGQIRIAMRAASLNFRDLLVLSGVLGATGPDGLVMCSDGAGEVIEVAPDVRRVKPGDRVALTFIPDWIAGPFRTSIAPFSRGFPLQGVMAEQLVAHENEAVVLPGHLSFEEGACLPCAGVTAWHALCGPAPLLPGMSVLLQGAGGVSVLALQFAKLFGARVIMTTSSDERAERLRKLGADAVINYRQEPEWDLAVRKSLGGDGVDLAVDVGGTETVDRAVKTIRKGGRLAIVGLLSGWPATISSLFATRVDVTPITVGSRNDFDDMNRAIAFHKMRPVIDRQFAFDELKEALRYLESGKQFGKIVISF